MTLGVYLLCLLACIVAFCAYLFPGSTCDAMTLSYGFLVLRTTYICTKTGDVYVGYAFTKREPQVVETSMELGFRFFLV